MFTKSPRHHELKKFINLRIGNRTKELSTQQSEPVLVISAGMDDLSVDHMYISFSNYLSYSIILMSDLPINNADMNYQNPSTAHPPLQHFV